MGILAAVGTFARVGWAPVEGEVDRVDIVVRGRRATVTDRFREHVEGKLAKLERFDHKAFRVDVELSRERNPRLSGVRERVELTVFSRGPVIRAEAAATDAYAALDVATAKITERMRRAADRRLRKHAQAPPPAALFDEVPPAEVDVLAGAPRQNGTQRRAGSSEPATSLTASASTGSTASSNGARPAEVVENDEGWVGDGAMGDASPMIVREKTHDAPAMTLDDALSNMELVGHDFYLFRDRETNLPAVVYRRRGYDYGVLRLRTVEMSDHSDSSGEHPGGLGASLAR